MSIAALILTDDYILLAGDGVCTDPDTGAVAGYVSKITTLPHLNCALAITGAGGFQYVLQWRTPKEITDFDEFIDALPAIVRETDEEMFQDQVFIGEETGTSVVAAGWSSAAQRYKAVRVLTYEKGSVDPESGDRTTLQPYVAHEIRVGDVWSSIAPTADSMELFGLSGNTEGQGDEEFLTRLICAGRASSGKASQDGSSCHFNAGGFVQLALVRRGDVRSWIAHRWPEDVVGKPIRPELGQPLPANLSMNDPE